MIDFNFFLFLSLFTLVYLSFKCIKRVTFIEKSFAYLFLKNTQYQKFSIIYSIRFSILSIDVQQFSIQIQEMNNNIKNQLNFSVAQWVLVSIRAFCLVSALGMNYFLHSLISILSSFFPFQIWKRYLSCLINLIMNRIIFLILGFFKFDCQNFGYFTRDQKKLTLKSGFIGMGTHKNIIDYFYYSYLFNPVFVKLILIVQKQEKQGKTIQTIKQVNYSPLNYAESLKCALQNRGFDPIIVRDQKQLKRIKYRKMNMKTLVSQCFQQLKGPIFIMLPGLKHDQHIQIQQKIAEDVFDNQLRFLRSGVGLKINYEQKQIYNKRFKNQIYFLLNFMSELKINHLDISALEFRKDFKYQYRKQTYRDFIQNNFYLISNSPSQVKHKRISYIEYVDQLDNQEKAQNKKQSESQVKNSQLKNQ